MTEKCSCKFCQFLPESNQVLTTIEMVANVDICFVTEESCLSDFSLSPDEIKRLIEALGFAVSTKDHVWEVAQRLRARK